MEKSSPKIGLIPLSLPRERTDLAGRFADEALAAVQGAGLDAAVSPGLAFDADHCLAAARAFDKQGMDCILILLGTWVFAPAVVDTVRAVNLPFGIWAVDDPATFSLTAGGIVHGSLDELGLKHRFLYGSPHSIGLIGEISAFARGAACRRQLSTERLCVIGGRVPGMYTTMADIVQLKEVFGVEVEHIDSLRVYLEAEALPEKEVAGLREELSAAPGRIDTDGKALDRSLRLYLALKRILTVEGYTMAAVKCQEEMINGYASFCLANSLLNDDGLTVSCEADINGALTMKILRAVSGEAALFGDVNHYDAERNLLRIVNCGSMPTRMAASRREVDLQDQYEYLGRAGGATTVLSVRESPVTVARLFRLRGRYAMVAWEGDTQDLPRERFAEARERWPQAMIRLTAGFPDTVQHLRSNHLHVCFGRHLAGLREFCVLTGIELIQPG